jgi:Arc/MetJ-type ribon-helix-helix transcriptional regulator
MMLRMKERVTISVEPEALEAARAEVEDGRAPNLSVAIEQALLERRRSEALREALEIWEEEHGPIGREAEEWARKELARALREASSSTPGH